MKLTLTLEPQPFNPWQRLAEFEAGFTDRAANGANAIFVGTMRDFNEGDSVDGMYLEHYPGMTEKQLEAIAEEAAAKWDFNETLILHRVGDIALGESIVLVAVWSAHRREAFEACRFLMEALKSRAPFWKKESLTSGSERWVEKNSDGY